MIALFTLNALALSAPSGLNASANKVFSAFAYGAAGDGKTNDTAAIQRTLDAAAAAGAGTAWLPANGTYLIGGGFQALGHTYDGVTFRTDGNLTVPKASWSTQAQCGWVNSSAGARGFPFSRCALLQVINVDRFTFTGYGSWVGFLFDEHKCALVHGKDPCPPNGDAACSRCYCSARKGASC